MTAADKYWSGNPDLTGDHATLADVEDVLTVAQGRILSEEMLSELAAQSAVGVARAEDLRAPSRTRSASSSRRGTCVAARSR